MDLLKNKGNFVVLAVLLILCTSLQVYAQTERWVYQYNGPANNSDVAKSIVYGTDGNIYASGYSMGTGTSDDLIVISLNKDAGDTNWVYRYNGPADSADRANSIVYGADGNIYIAGYSRGSGTGDDFTVISLTSDGIERWVYRYNGPADSNDCASSLVYGSDGNIYAAGWLDAIEFSGYPMVPGKFVIISLTSTGGERWVYQYIGPFSDRGEAYSIDYGTDGNIYAAGFSRDSGVGEDFVVISVTALGDERFVYRDIGGVANSLVYGGDGNIYAAGYTTDSWFDVLVISLTSAGAERWVYVYSGPPGSSGDDLDEAYSLVYGADGNIYVAGVSDSTDAITPTADFTVISLTSSGSERWVYRYVAAGNDRANSLVYGTDDYIYAAGNTYNLRIVSLTPLGSERWSYQYDGGTYRDEAYSIVYGADSNIYTSGMSNNYLVWRPDFIIISLDPELGIEGQSSGKINKGIVLLTSTIQNNNLEFTLSLAEPSNVTLFLHSITGERILSWRISVPSGTSCYTKNLPTLSSGVYVLKAETTKKKYGESRKLIYVK